MNNKDLAKNLIDTIPEERLPYVISYLEGASIPDYAKPYNTVISKDKIEITDEVIYAILYTCYCDSNSWCYASVPRYYGKYNHCDDTVLWTIKTFDDSKIYDLTRGKLLDGITHYFSSDDCIVEVCKKDGKVYLDLDSIDYDAANSILQYSLFGKIVY